jgi:hypothetical protein
MLLLHEHIWLGLAPVDVDSQKKHPKNFKLILLNLLAED